MRSGRGEGEDSVTVKGSGKSQAKDDAILGVRSCLIVRPVLKTIKTPRVAAQDSTALILAQLRKQLLRLGMPICIACSQLQHRPVATPYDACRAKNRQHMPGPAPACIGLRTGAGFRQQAREFAKRS